MSPVRQWAVSDPRSVIALIAGLSLLLRHRVDMAVVAAEVHHAIHDHGRRIHFALNHGAETHLAGGAVDAENVSSHVRRVDEVADNRGRGEVTRLEFVEAPLL